MEKKPSKERYERFVGLLRDYMRREGLKQYQLAERAGIGESTLSRILAGKQIPETDTINRLADVLGLNWAALYEVLEGTTEERELQLKQVLHELRQLDALAFELVAAQIRAAAQLQRGRKRERNADSR